MKIKNTAIAAMALILSLGSAPAKADVTPLAFTLLLTAGWTTFMILEDMGFSSDNKEAMLGTVSDEAAAFIANDGQNPSALLSNLIASARAEIKKSGVSEEFTDLEIAQALLHGAEKTE